MSAISELKRAKEHSDKRQYGVKHQIIKKMMTDDPDAFFIDSDDGKGIVGVTHKKTGFRFHMPAGKVKPGLSKEAGLGQVVGRLAQGVSKATDGSPKIKDALRRLMDYNLVDRGNRSTNTAVMAAMGAPVGAAIGVLRDGRSLDGIMSDDRARGDGIVGSYAGALVGALVGRYGPHAAQRGIGRILTNVLDPYDYSGAPAKMLRSIKADPLGVIKSIAKDKPYYHPAMSGTDDLSTVRELPHRAMFGMKPRAGKDTYTQKGDNLFSFSDSVSGKAMQDELINPIVPGYHTGVLGKYHRTDLPDGSVGYSDVWDVDLERGEKPWGSTSNALRWALSKFTNPVTIEGVVKRPTADAVPEAVDSALDKLKELARSRRPAIYTGEPEIATPYKPKEIALPPTIYTGGPESMAPPRDPAITLESLW